MSQDHDIHAAVQSRYARLVEQANEVIPLQQATSCCGDGTDECGCGSGYLVDLSEVPSEVAEFSLGCGDPISIAELQPGEVVVDLGSGGGLDAFLASKRVGEKGLVVGIDMTPQMVERAMQSRDKQGITNVEFKLGKIEDMPLPKDFADVIISNCVINLAPEKKAVFEEAFRVLKSGGRFAVADIVTRGEMTEVERANMDAWSECMTGAIDVDVYLNQLREVGFVDVQVTHEVDYPTTGRFSVEVLSARITARKPKR